VPAAGERVRVNDVILEIVEVIPYRTISGRKDLLVGYKIINGKFTFPVAHIWGRENANWRLTLKEVVEHYLEMRKKLGI